MFNSKKIRYLEENIIILKKEIENFKTMNEELSSITEELVKSNYKNVNIIKELMEEYASLAISHQELIAILINENIIKKESPLFRSIH